MHDLIGETLSQRLVRAGLALAALAIPFAYVKWLNHSAPYFDDALRATLIAGGSILTVWTIGFVLNVIFVAPFTAWKEAELRADNAAAQPLEPQIVIHRHERDPADFSVVGSSLKRMIAEGDERRRATLANPMPNIDMKTALDWITDKTKKEGDSARDELHDLASVGAIKVWGRAFKRVDPNPLREIPQSAWIDHFMFWRGAESGADNEESYTQHKNGFVHRELQFCSEQIIDHYKRNRR